MKKKLRQAYIRGMIDLSVFVATFEFYVWIGMYTIEKYFM